MEVFASEIFKTRVAVWMNLSRFSDTVMIETSSNNIPSIRFDHVVDDGTTDITSSDKFNSITHTEFNNQTKEDDEKWSSLGLLGTSTDLSDTPPVVSEENTKGVGSRFTEKIRKISECLPRPKCLEEKSRKKSDSILYEARKEENTLEFPSLMNDQRGIVAVIESMEMRRNAMCAVTSISVQQGADGGDGDSKPSKKTKKSFRKKKEQPMYILNKREVDQMQYRKVCFVGGGIGGSRKSGNSGIRFFFLRKSFGISRKQLFPGQK